VNNLTNISGLTIAVIGLGYVGLPLALAFAEKNRVIGLDLNKQRIQELLSGIDITKEIELEQLRKSRDIIFTDNEAEIASANVYIVTVPTPINDHKQPDLGPLKSASRLIGKYLKDNDIVVYESTVYPGATEEECVPILEQVSGLVFNQNFYVGYSPERINPGDKEHTITNILKITSGSTVKTADFIDLLYRSIVAAGTVKVSSIKVAESAKVIENIQRDVNIALVNELAIIFNKLNIDTLEVLEAAGTKWNFLPFRPGLVGGHCIGVDPYYLTHKAQHIGYNPEMILAGRRLNDSMAHFVASQLIKAMLKKRIHVGGSRILIMGVTFKENCPDIRNTKIIDVINELEEYGATVDIYDPHAISEELAQEYNKTLIDSPADGAYDAIILAVAHAEFQKFGKEDVRVYLKDEHIIYDLKYVLPVGLADIRL